MTPTNIFRIVLRIMSIYVVKDLIGTATTVYYSLDVSDSGESFILLALGLIAYCGVIYLLLFQTDTIIRLLKLDSGFKKEEFSFYEQSRKDQLDSTILLNMAFLVTAVFMIIGQIPVFLRDLSVYHIAFQLNEPRPIEMIAISGGKILLGIIILGTHKQLVRFIERRSGKDEENDTSIQQDNNDQRN